jgi:predicted Zn finger-like uncharacterized protein
MDVRCEKCKTEYEFDDARISEAGVTVKCTSCGHIFKVKKKALLLTVPVSPHDLESRSAAVPAASAERAREWKVRQSSGNVFTFKELTTLQKWIVERKVTRDDEISLTGESWKRLGNIAELASFFQVVEEAQRAQTMTPAPLGGPVVMTPPSGYGLSSVPPPPPPPSGGFMVPQPLGAPAPPLTGTYPAPRRTTSQPRFSVAPLPMEMDDDLERAGVKKGGALKWILVLLLLGGLGGGGYYGYFYLWLPEQQRQAVVEKEKADAEYKLKAQLEASSVKEKTDADAKARADKQKADEEAKARALAAQVAAAAAAADAGSPDGGGAATAKKEPPHDYDWYMARGDRLREADRAAAALDAYGKAVDMAPDRSEAIAGTGLAFLDMGRNPQAETAFKRALSLNPRYGVAIMGLAETYRALGRKDEAVQYYEKYLDVLPDSPEASVAKNAIEKLKQ